jgi:hypothetical protein
MQLVDGKIGDLVLDERDLAATRMAAVERLLRDPVARGGRHAARCSSWS